ncbi:MAG: MBL fold metallo-hydrolase [Candidatus Bathyarchaeota archaeon]|nr:MBL fold metallo-hydrolase [Candidatus Bathyarchaeota archaeon]
MSSLQIKFLGGTREVGRSAIALKTKKTQVLLDYGVMLNHEPGFPMHIPPKDVDAIILTHSHLDHSGAIPIFYIHEKKTLYTNKLTSELNELLISDFIHLSSYYLPFEYLELKSMTRNSRHVDFGVEEKIGDIKFQLSNAGHIPGSAQILIDAEGKKLLYTGDFNTEDTRLLEGAKMEYNDLDAVIIESTYADEEHTERSELEKKFIADATDIVEMGGTVLIPAFGVGRSQEVACILAAHHFEHPVTIDGMIRGANSIMMRHGQFLRDSKLLKDALNSAHWIEGWRDRRKTARKPGVIISTAGMLKGGPSVFYISKIGKKAHDAVFLVSYQIPGTPGRQLLDKGVCVIDGKMRKIKARVGHFDFSSHCGASELKESVKKLGGTPEIYVIHGAEGNCKLLARWIKKELGFEAIAPKTGDTFKV